MKRGKTIKKLKQGYKYLKLLFIYLPYLNFKSLQRKEIIIVFDGNFAHGGLVDRLKGIISFYAISKEIGADFKIYFKHPFRLETFLEFNDKDWIATESDLKFNPFQSEFLFLMDDFSFDWRKKIKDSKKLKFVVYSNIDYLNSIYSDSDKEQFEAKWSTLFYELFRKSEFLNNEIEKLKLPAEYIAIHTRFTSLLGDFKDTSIRSISEERKSEMLELLKNEIKLLDSNFPKIVFSDSILFLNHIKEYTDSIVLEGMPSHIDVGNSRSDYANLKTFVDFFVISEAKGIYLFRTKEMHNSAFSKYASYLHNKPFSNLEVKNNE